MPGAVQKQPGRGSGPWAEAYGALPQERPAGLLAVLEALEGDADVRFELGQLVHCVQVRRFERATRRPGTRWSLPGRGL